MQNTKSYKIQSSESQNPISAGGFYSQLAGIDDEQAMQQPTLKERQFFL